MINDLRYALRMLKRNPGFTLVALCTLALGIGASTAIFSVVNAVLWQPLGFRDPGRLVWIGGWLRGVDKEQCVTPADFVDYRERCRSFESLAASISDGISMIVSGDGDPERILGASVTANYLEVFGITPALGRTFSREEDLPGRDRVVVLSHALWQRRFGGDPEIVNRSMTIDGLPCNVIGVMPAGFAYPTRAELWKPFGFSGPPQGPFRSRELHFLRPVAKLKEGVSLAQAQAEVESVAREIEATFPRTNTNRSLFLFSLHERIVGNIEPTLLVLLGGVGCILLIATGNVASLLLARAAMRSKEMAVRAALGASRWQVIRQMLIEGLVLALIGAAAGVLLAHWGTRVLVTLSAGHLPRAGEVQMSIPALIFALGVAILAGLLFGLMPAQQVARQRLVQGPGATSKGASGSRPRHRMLNALVIGEMAFAVVLLIGAGLLVNSFMRLQGIDPGFDDRGLLTVKIDLAQPYAEPQAKLRFFEQLHERVAGLAGVEAVGMVTELPLANQSADFWFSIAGQDAPANGQGHPADTRNVNHDYFRAMRIPLLRGRNVTESDVHDSRSVALISDSLAKRYFAHVDPVGRRLYIGSSAQNAYAIIGVVGDVRHRQLQSEPMPTIYVPSLQFGYSSLVIRTSADPTSLFAAVRREVHAIDPGQPLGHIRTMEQWVSESVALPRLRTSLVGGFSVAALSLAIVGIYGLMAYVVVQQTRDIGIRMALGASRRDVIRMVLAQGMKLTTAGLVIGLVVALGLTRSMASLLFGIQSTDLPTYIAISAVLAAASLVACVVPAVRAARVDPMVALRSE